MKICHHGTSLNRLCLTPRDIAGGFLYNEKSIEWIKEQCKKTAKDKFYNSSPKLIYKWVKIYVDSAQKIAQLKRVGK